MKHMPLLLGNAFNCNEYGVQFTCVRTLMFIWESVDVKGRDGYVYM